MFDRIRKSAKVQTAFLTFLAALLVAAFPGIDEPTATKLLGLLGALGVSVIGGISYEDAGKGKPGDPPVIPPAA